jgi:hypothetical protein
VLPVKIASSGSHISIDNILARALRETLFQSRKCRLVEKQDPFVRGTSQLQAVYFYQRKKINEYLGDVALVRQVTEKVQSVSLSVKVGFLGAKHVSLLFSPP